MSSFDAYDTALSGAVFGFYGDTCQFQGGPLNPGKSAEGVAILDVDKVLDDSGFLVSEVVIVEYPRTTWPHPRRGDQLSLKGATWQVADVRKTRADTITVEVIAP